jgi:hypothetical protein
MRDALRGRYPDQLGEDGAFYEYGIASSSQRENRSHAILALAIKLAELSPPAT